MGLLLIFGIGLKQATPLSEELQRELHRFYNVHRKCFNHLEDIAEAKRDVLLVHLLVFSATLSEEFVDATDHFPLLKLVYSYQKTTI